jgi:hypothetical protein
MSSISYTIPEISYWRQSCEDHRRSKFYLSGRALAVLLFIFRGAVQHVDRQWPCLFKCVPSFSVRRMVNRLYRIMRAVLPPDALRRAAVRRLPLSPTFVYRLLPPCTVT